MRATLILLAVLAATPVAAQTPPDLKAVLGQASGALLQADGPRAAALLQDIPVEPLEAKDAVFRDCVLERLDPVRPLEIPGGNASFTERALYAYRLYWRAASQRPETREAEEKALAVRLGGLLGRPDLDDMRAAEAPTLDRIKAEGGYVLGGRTGRLLDLMLWNRQDERDVSTTLPEGVHSARLFVLDDFTSRGWSNWMTCGRTGTGGWAKPEGLHVVVPAYESLEDEVFKVTFLAHETQHYADNAAWVGMPGWQLEFRAKLTEVALMDATRQRTLTSFTINQGDDPDEAHSYANRRVLTALRERLGLDADADLMAVAPARLRAAARAELFADTRRRPTPLTAR